ncbi:MAG: T9SS type A sorting domain-containing protein [Bacteroidales bacterium]|nr:T9SS type A sorting domain-containing protein [Bacteroidales bacterium]
MKKTAFILLLISIIVNCLAQSVKHVEVTHSSYDKITLTLTAGEISATTVNTDKGLFSRIGCDGFLPYGNDGSPELPALVSMLEIPLCDGINVSITRQEWQSFATERLGISHPVYPRQPSRSKSEKGPFELVINNEVYATDAFCQPVLVELEKVGVARDKNLATLYFSPYNYNPVSGELKICTRAEVEITFRDADIEATEKMKTLHNSLMFASASTINRLPQNTDKIEFSTTPIRYLIVAHNSFSGLLDTFADWKRRKGFITDIVYTGTAAVGTTTTSIANYIKSQYTNATAENPAPTFLLLVGDVQQIPAFRGNADNHATDLYYASWTNGDNIPDCYYGRFSAQNVDQLTPQIEKTLMYEQYKMPQTTYLERTLLIAGIDDGEAGDRGYTHADPTMKYLRNTYIDTSYGYSYVGYYDNSDYTLDSRGNATGMTHIISNILSRGTCLAIYSAHGSSSGWANPKFGKEQLPELYNNKKIGIVIGNCCSSCTYNDDECFGEALLRLPDHRGAIGYIGGSNSTYWTEDYYWAVGIRNIGSNGAVPTYNAYQLGAFDRLYHTHNESQRDWYVTQGGIVQSGNMAVQNSSSTKKIYYWEVYHLMGDPSVMPWLHRAQTMEVSVSSTIGTDATMLSVRAVPYAYAALTDSNHNLVAAAFVNVNGRVAIHFSPLPAGTYELAVSAQHYKTNFTTINVSSSEAINIADNNSFRVYPNPAKQTLFVEGDDISQISLINMLGNEVYTSVNNGQDKVEIPVNGFCDGIYVLCLTDKNGKKSFRKIVVKK